MQSSLYFRYSYIYQKTLSRLGGQEFSDQEFQDGLDFTRRYSEHWKQYSQQVFDFFGKQGMTFAEFWIAYFVKSQDQLTPFSDPLTLLVNEDFEELTSILVHELTHVMLTYPDNFDVWNKLWQHVGKTYPEHGFDLNVEIITVLITRACLISFWGLERTERVLSKEKGLPILGKAWAVIDKQPEVLAEPEPLKAIMLLK